ncbi:MAG: hypothetical protein ACI9T8_000555, partial [Candidatus Saccharimonadales bacterium]
MIADMGKTRRSIEALDKLGGTGTPKSHSEETIQCLNEVFGQFYVKGIEIANEVRRKADDGEYIWPTLMNAYEKDFGLSAGFKAGFGLTPECTIEEAAPLIKESLGGLIIIRSEIVEEDGRDTLRVFEKEIIDQQDWGLP